MKKILIGTSLVFFSITFGACSNMTVGFEEDSPFYNGSLLDTRDDVVVKKKDTITHTNIKEVVEIKKVEIVKPKKLKTEKINIKNKVKDKSESTFYYERDDE